MMEQSIFLDFFGGVSEDGFSWMVDFEKVLLELARWLLPIGVCLLAEGVWLERWRKIEPLSRYRYETVKRWWRRKFVKSLSGGMAVAAVLLFAAMAVDIVTYSAVNGGVCELGGILPAGVDAVFLSGGVWKTLILWLSHIATLLSFFLVLDLTKMKRLAPAMLLLLEGFTFLVGFVSMGAARFMYGMWGMYFQSEWYYGETGVSVLPSLMTEGILLVLSFMAGQILLKRQPCVLFGNMRNFK